jgi:long-subunit fatty acid transport protein
VFHGGMLGLMGTKARGRWSIDWLAKASLGATHQRIRIAGSTTVIPPVGAANTTNGGLLAQPTNIGEYENSQTVVIPEFTSNLNYHMNSNLSLGIGFNALWMSAAVTAGDQIDRQVNPSQFGGGPLIGPARPAFNFVQDDYWLMGINMSLRAEY